MRNADYRNINQIGTTEYAAITTMDETAAYLRTVADRINRISCRAVSMIEYDKCMGLDTWVHRYLGEVLTLIEGVEEGVDEILSNNDERVCV